MENEVLTMSNLRTTENKGIFSGNMLKIFALVCMTIDHIGLYLMENSYPMRAIGRLAFPIFASILITGLSCNVQFLQHGVPASREMRRYVVASI